MLGLQGRRCLVKQSRNLTYQPPGKDIKFLFDDVLGMHEHYKTLPEGVADEATSEFVTDVIEANSTLAAELLLPSYQSGDAGCVWKDTDVSTPKGFKEAFDAYKEGGWQGLNYPTEYGGMGLPLSLALVKNEICATANWSWFMYPGLTQGAINTILAHGSPDMKTEYLPKLIDLTYTGTMCLTEPHCGTDLGQMKTKAVPNDDGTYSITGTKIFISAGEHDLAENIVHIVLAKLPDAPNTGSKSISLFLVPKYLRDENTGELITNKKNAICGSIEKKMGIHGCSTSQMHFEGSIGWIIGEKHDGLRQMFTFMNTARIGTGIQGLAHMELSFQNAISYANERTSMRALSGTKEPEAPGDLIVHHGDVRKNLMTAKALTEGSRALLYDIAKMGDKQAYAQAAGDHALADKIEDDMGFLTPVAKGCVTEWACEVTNLMMQCYGGHGYIKDHGMEQIVRDCRIATLYEGTTGIQGLDLLGRKTLLNKLVLFKKYTREYLRFGVSCLKTLAFPKESYSFLRVVAAWNVGVLRIAINSKANKDNVSVASVDNLFCAGYVILAHQWLRMGHVAHEKLKKKGSGISPSEKAFLEGKIATMKFYFAYILPRFEAHLLASKASPESVYAIDKANLNIKDI